MGESDEVLSSQSVAWLDDALRGMQRASDAEVAEFDLATGFDDLPARLWAAEDARKSRARRRRIVLTLAVAGVVATTGGAAAAIGMRGALTGIFGSGGNTENDTSEYVDASQPDFPRLARGWAAQLRDDGLRFAPGYDPDRNVAAVVANLRRSAEQHHSRVQVTGVKGSIALAAACSWELSWLAAHRDGDAGGMRAAVSELRRTAGLKIMSQVNGATWLVELAHAADQGDIARVQTDATLNCTAVVR